jgi:hypothetical protein
MRVEPSEWSPIIKDGVFGTIVVAVGMDGGSISAVGPFKFNSNNSSWSPFSISIKFGLSGSGGHPFVCATSGESIFLDGGLCLMDCGRNVERPNYLQSRRRPSRLSALRAFAEKKTKCSFSFI